MRTSPPEEADAGAAVIVVDDDAAVRGALCGLFQSVGLGVSDYPSGQGLLADLPGMALDGPRCLVLDVRLPGRSGLEVYDALVRGGVRIPVVFISGHADVPMAVRAMKAGASEVLTKPVRSQDLLDAVQAALEADRLRRAGARRMAALLTRFASLTGREREIMALVAAGRRNKQIAAAVGISEATVKLHRGHVMAKMNAGSAADLVHMIVAVEGAGAGTTKV